MTGNDPVWCEGMADWRPAAEQFPDMFQPGFGGVYSQHVPGLVPVLPPGGTGGRTPNAELNAQALKLLSGRWGLPIGFGLLATLISVGSGMVPYIGFLVQLILAGPLVLGVMVFFLTFTRGGQGDLGMLFAGFKAFGQGLAAFLLRWLMLLGWMLLGMGPGLAVLIYALIRLVILFDRSPYNPHIESTNIPMLLIVGAVLAIPGYILLIVKTLSYSQTMYIVADDVNIGTLTAIRRSVQLMNGKKGKLFYLWLRYFGWSLLCILTLYIGFLWLVPYMHTGLTRFYDDLQEPPQGQPMSAGFSEPTFGQNL